MTRFRLPALVAAVLLTACAHPVAAPDEARVFHVVLCWLNDPGNTLARQKIIAASRSFAAIPGVVDVKAGPAIASDRAIVDDSFDVGILITFADRQAMHSYLKHPLHRQAVADVLKPLVRRIVVYDFNDAAPH